MSKALIKPNMKTELVKLTASKTEYINDDIVSDTKPVTPIGIVSRTTAGIRTSFGSLRWMFLVPWLIGLIATLYWHIEDFYSVWKAKERSYVEFVDHRKKIYGEDYFSETSNNVALEMYSQRERINVKII